MNSLEQNPELNEMPQFGIDLNAAEFDINSAFQNALTGVASDEELALDEKVRRMEVIVNEGNSEVYRDFVDFRQLAAQMEMMCAHDHGLNDSIKNNETLLSFMDDHNANDGHNHGSSHHKNSDDEIDPKTGKKKKKKQRGWFGVYFS